jgi:hypothetical protein
MLLIRLEVRAPGQPRTRGVSVWVDEHDIARGQERAARALAAEGWSLVAVLDALETTADDYFQPCPSQQAFQRASRGGVAWRFDDE